MMRDGDHAPLRLLPWSGQGGKPLYLSTDRHGGRLTREADIAESVQLRMAAELLDHSDALLVQRGVSTRELRHLAHCLTCSLHETVRIAASRGSELSAYRACRAYGATYDGTDGGAV